MRLVHWYLVAYAALVTGAIVALWSGDALQRLPWTWSAIGLLLAVGSGVLLFVTSRETVPVSQ